MMRWLPSSVHSWAVTHLTRSLAICIPLPLYRICLPAGFKLCSPGVALGTSAALAATEALCRPFHPHMPAAAT